MKKTSDSLNDMLLAIFKYKNSLTTLQEKNWYHIPVKTRSWEFPNRKMDVFLSGQNLRE